MKVSDDDDDVLYVLYDDDVLYVLYDDDVLYVLYDVDGVQYWMFVFVCRTYHTLFEYLLKNKKSTSLHFKNNERPQNSQFAPKLLNYNSKYLKWLLIMILKLTKTVV